MDGRHGIGQNLLSLVSWDGRSVDTVSDTSDASSDDELGSSTTVWRNASNLDDDTDDHDNSTEEDTLATTKLVTKDEDEACTEETSDSVDGDDETFVGGVILDLGESFDEGRGRDDTTHDTLIVTEEKEVGDGNDGHKDLEHPTGLPPVGGHTRVAFFDTWRHGGDCIDVKLECSEEMLGMRRLGRGYTFK